MRKRWPILLATNSARYRFRISLGFHPDIHVMWRDVPIGRLLPSETRVHAWTVDVVDARLRASALLE